MSILQTFIFIFLIFFTRRVSVPHICKHVCRLLWDEQKQFLLSWLTSNGLFAGEVTGLNLCTDREILSSFHKTNSMFYCLNGKIINYKYSQPAELYVCYSNICVFSASHSGIFTQMQSTPVTRRQTVTVSPHISHTDLRPTCHAGQQGECSPQRKKIRKRKEKRRKSRIRMKMYCINQTNHPHRVSFVSWGREEKPEWIN